MTKKQKYEELAEKVVELVGGKENIEFFTHCVTRLRFNVKDKSSVRKEEIENIPGVVGSQWSGDQLQIIIGQSVGDAYQLICDRNGLKKESAIDENLDKDTKNGKITFGSILDSITGCITPLLPVLIGAGMLKIIILLLEMTGILQPGTPTHTVLTFVGDAGFYFLPVYVGATAANKFGANLALGMLVGAMFIHPTFVAAVANGDPLSILGLPINPTGYANSILPALLSVWLMAPIEKFFAKISPDSVRSITEPLLTILVMIPLALCLIGPIGSFLGTYIAAAIMWLYNKAGFLGVGILSALMPLIVMTGMHSSLFPYAITTFTTLGYEPIVCTSMVISNINQGVAALAVALKTKNTNLKSVGGSTGVTSILGGVCEPAVYGVNLKYKTPFYATLIGSLVAGCIAGFGRAFAYGMSGSAGVFALPVYFAGGVQNLIWMCAALAVGAVVTFVMTLILYKDEKKGE